VLILTGTHMSINGWNAQSLGPYPDFSFCTTLRHQGLVKLMKVQQSLFFFLLCGYESNQEYFNILNVLSVMWIEKGKTFSYLKISCTCNSQFTRNHPVGLLVVRRQCVKLKSDWLVCMLHYGSVLNSVKSPHTLCFLASLTLSHSFFFEPSCKAILEHRKFLK
jgi:hypothetical protein